MNSKQSVPSPSSASLRGLDLVNVFAADVRDGVGPYLAIFLKTSQHWEAGPIGIAMAAASVSAALFQVPAGALVDRAHAKRALFAAAGLAVAAACLLIVWNPNFASVIAGQIVLGAAAAILPPSIAAISLGLVGKARLDARISRNETFNHTGNLLSALLAGALATWFGTAWIFYLVCAFAAANAAMVMRIQARDIDHDRARGGESSRPNGAPMPVRALLRRSDLRVFLGSVMLFHLGNAAMLPMAGQMLARTHPGTEAVALSACIVTAQLVMVGVAMAVGRASARGVGRKTIFLVALAVLPARGLLFTLTTSPFGVVGIQTLDGVAAGIFGVISILIASDLTQGTGRFNMLQGLVALATGVGAGLSNVIAGYVVQYFGSNTGFLCLAALALAALIFFAVLMPETGPQRDSLTGATQTVV